MMVGILFGKQRRHGGMPIKDRLFLSGVRRLAVEDIVHLIPEFPAEDVGGIAPSGDDVTEQVLRDPDGLLVGKELQGTL